MCHRGRHDQRKSGEAEHGQHQAKRRHPASIAQRRHAMPGRASRSDRGKTRRAVCKYALEQLTETAVGAARHLAAWVAAIVFFVLGAIWYSVLSAQWLPALRKTQEEDGPQQASEPHAA